MGYEDNLLGKFVKADWKPEEISKILAKEISGHDNRLEDMEKKVLGSKVLNIIPTPDFVIRNYEKISAEEKGIYHQNTDYPLLFIIVEQVEHYSYEILGCVVDHNHSMQIINLFQCEIRKV